MPNTIRRVNAIMLQERLLELSCLLNITGAYGVGTGMKPLPNADVEVSAHKETAGHARHFS